MSLTEPEPATRETAAAVSVQERAPQRRRDRPGPGPDLHDAPVLVVLHHHPARVARQALRRFRGNVRPVLEEGLAGLIRVRQHWRVELVVEGCLREQGRLYTRFSEASGRVQDGRSRDEK